jgi:phosphocarrier protein HPr
MEMTVTVTNEEGMHARPAGIFVKKAGEFKSHVQVKANGQSKNGKSIMSLMSLGIKGGQNIIIETQGEDAEAALKALVDLVNQKFVL